MSDPVAAPFARMPFYPRDFRSSTLGWPLVARGIYLELLFAQWDNGGTNVGTLPEDEEALRMIAGATPTEWKAAWRFAEPKFPKVPGGRRNARLEAHRKSAVEEFTKRRKGAMKTNAKRWGHQVNGVADEIAHDFGDDDANESRVTS
jgi:uncharacterized protein YdaU (DUF1376 family)